MPMNIIENPIPSPKYLHASIWVGGRWLDLRTPAFHSTDDCRFHLLPDSLPQAWPDVWLLDLTNRWRSPGFCDRQRLFYIPSRAAVGPSQLEIVERSGDSFQSSCFNSTARLMRTHSAWINSPFARSFDAAASASWLKFGYASKWLRALAAAGREAFLNETCGACLLPGIDCGKID